MHMKELLIFNFWGVLEIQFENSFFMTWENIFRA